MAPQDNRARMPDRPKIYHIVHVDRLPSIIRDGALWCDAEAVRRGSPGSTIGMGTIKQRRLTELTLTSYPDLHVGDCVPFYFCPRSVMLYVIHMANHPGLTYRGGQGPIVHLQADLHAVVGWAHAHGTRWAFTTSNAGSGYFEDYNDVADLARIDWAAVRAHNWQHQREGKQAEFLVERSFPWTLVERIGVKDAGIREDVARTIAVTGGSATTGTGIPGAPPVAVRPDWYY